MKLLRTALITLLLIPNFAETKQGSQLDFLFSSKAGEALNDVIVSITPLSAPAKRALNASKPKLQAVIQYRRTYYPYTLPVRKGTDVIFPNLDSIKHHVYSFDKKMSFELKTVAEKQIRTESVKFDTPGAYTIGCRLHDSMIAHIYVVDTPLYSRSLNGKARVQEVPPGAYRIEAWHSDMRGEKKRVLNERYEVRLNSPPAVFDYELDVDSSLRPKLIATNQKEFEGKLPRSMQMQWAFGNDQNTLATTSRRNIRGSLTIEGKELASVIGAAANSVSNLTIKTVKRPSRPIKTPAIDQKEIALVIAGTGIASPTEKSKPSPKIDPSELEQVIGQ